MAKVKNEGRFYSGNQTILDYIGVDHLGDALQEIDSDEYKNDKEGVTGEVAFFDDRVNNRIKFVYSRSDSEGLFANDRPYFSRADVKAAQNEDERLYLMGKATIARIKNMLNGVEVNEHNTVE